jgi:plasmid stabilization system protein ParE
MEVWDEGTGDCFYDEVLASVRMLEAFPHIGPLAHRGKVRRAVVFNRHYGLFYVVENRGLILHALLDLRQDPESVMLRLRGI